MTEQQAELTTSANGDAELSAAEAIEQLIYIKRGTSPRRALAAAIRHKDEVIPRLLVEAALTPEEVQARFKAEPDDDTTYYLHSLAFYLLGLFEEPRAWSLALDFFTADPEQAENLTGDMVTEHLAGILARCYDGSGLERLQSIIETSSLDAFLRDACFAALHGLALRGHIERAELVAYAERLLDRHETVPSSLWNALLISAVADLQAPPLRPKLEGLFERGLVDTECIARKDLEWIYSKDARKLGESVLRKNFFDNFVDRVCRWWWFEPKTGEPKLDAAELAYYTRHLETPFVRDAPKVGRNEPCPCGSGKKYKKCCLGTDAA